MDHAGGPDAARKAPLLALELVLMPDGSIAYSTPLEGIHSRVVALFDRAVTKLQVCVRPALSDQYCFSLHIRPEPSWVMVMG